MSNISIREELSRYGHKTASAGLVAGAGGNISARDGNIIWMKPSGYAMEDLQPDDFCGIDIVSGQQVSGKNKPTSEVNMHLAVYRVRSDVMAIFHTHSPWASGVISAGIELKPMFAEFAGDLGKIGTIPYITPTTQALANAMAEKIRTCDTIMMINHGILAVGSTIKQAFYRCAVVEDAAKSLIAACIVGKPQFLTQQQIDEILSLDAVKHRAKIMEQNNR